MTKPYETAPFVCALILLSALTSTTLAISACTDNESCTYDIQNPDGSSVRLRLEGDEFEAYEIDAFTGYRVAFDESDHSYKYAERKSDGSIGSSGVRVPAHKEAYQQNSKIKNGRKRTLPLLQKTVVPDEEWKEKHCCDNNLICCSFHDDDRPQDISYRESSPNMMSLRSSPSLTKKGSMKNLVILLQWSNHLDRSLPSVSDIDTLMNHKGPHPKLCPTGSVRDVYYANSYGTFSLDSVVLPWIPMNNSEQYYADGQRGTSIRIHGAVRYALQYAEKYYNVDYSEYDEDGDGFVDSLTVLHSGYASEWGGVDADGVSHVDRIWSHKWTIHTNGYNSNQRGAWRSVSSGVSVLKYHISPALWGRKGADIGRVGVIAHEIGHFLGLPDLYDSDGGGNGLGNYGLMGNAWGFDGSQRYPPSMSAWAKMQLGWITATEIETAGTYSLAASEHTAQAYKLSIGYKEGEYLLIENRQQVGFDAMMPQGGLAIYHIDETKASLDDEGHPSQPDYPHNGRHYKVALMQADGLFHLEKGMNRGDENDLFHGGESGGVDAVGPSDVTGRDVNTDGYGDGKVRVTGNDIHSISASGDVMSFCYMKCDDITPYENPIAGITSYEFNTPKSGYNIFANGYMWDITAKKDIIVTNLKIQARKTNRPIMIKVFSKKGSWKGFDKNKKAWTNIANVKVKWDARKKSLSLPQHAFSPQVIAAGSTRAFYVHCMNCKLSGINNRARRTNRANRRKRNTKFSNEHLTFKGGNGLRRLFTGNYRKSMSWTGSVVYECSQDGNRQFSSLSKSTRIASEVHKLKTDIKQSYSQVKGYMLELKAKTDVVITNLMICTATKIKTGRDKDEKVTLHIYSKTGSFAGYERNHNAWTFVNTVRVTPSTSLNDITSLPLGSITPTVVSDNSSVAYYLHCVDCHFAMGTENENVEDEHLVALHSRAMTEALFSGGRLRRPLSWTGGIVYELAS